MSADREFFRSVEYVMYSSGSLGRVCTADQEWVEEMLDEEELAAILRLLPL